MKRKKPHTTFLPKIDAEHKILFSTSEGLHQALMAGMEAGQLQPVIRALMQRINAHLSNEERMMRAAGYPSFDWHRHSHDTARRKFSEFAGRAESGDSAAVSELVEFFSAWLTDHTGLHDRMMGAYLRNFERAATAAS